MRPILILLLAFSLVLGCGGQGESRSTTTPASGTEREKQRWIAEGWSFLERFGGGSADGEYLSHMSSGTARTITAFASSSGFRTNKVYAQTNALFLVVAMGQPSGDTFALVFKKTK